MTKITYPTGGSTEFDFGMHRIKPDNARNCRELAAPIGANVGGFRINAITDRDETGAIASSRQFSYKNEDNTSSGKLMYALEYHQMTTNHHIPWENCAVINGTGQYDCDDYICGRVTIFANNTSKYASKAGPHIGYSRVVERTGSGGAIGKTAYEFTNEYPSTADIWDIYNGTLEAVKTYDSQDRIVREEYYIEPNTSTVAALNGCPDSPQRCFDEYHPFIIVADPDQTNQLVLCEMPNGQNRWIHEFDDNTGCLDHKIFYTKFIKYDHYAEQKWKRSTYKKTIDYSYSDLAPGTVEKTTLYEYNDPQIAKPTSTSFHNSDGKEHRTEIEYLHAGYINAIPKKTTKKVDGQITGGTYIDFDLVGRPLVLSEILKGGTILERGVIGGYNGFGRPISYKYMDFPTEEYTWTNGLLTQRQQLDWIWKYDYNEQRLLRKFTDIDGQESFYDYDGLLRLLHSSSRGGNVSVDYKYNYLLLNGGDNYVKTTEHYSDFQDQISKQTIDGLGRPLQTIKIGYGPHGEDVLTEDLDYDGHGRVVQKVYIPDEEGGLTYTTMTYEKSPLSRLLTETFPDGNKVVTEYGGTGNYYFTKSTDENGNGTTTKTDILGRQISKTDPLGGLTEYEYDNRNNLLKVTNPENQDYLFTYDNRNRMRTKKVPGADCTEFYFENGRDLMVASQDGNLREQGKWIATEYDPFGRVLRTGFYNHNAVIYCNLPAGQVPNEPNDFLPVPQDELTINIYDVESGATCDVNQNDNIFKGKLTATSARVLEEGGLTGWVDTKYCFDDFGRQVRTEISTPYGKDEYENDYNFADIVKASRRDFNSGELAYSHLNLIDHSGRITYSGFEGGGTSYKFNSKDQLVRKSLGGLAELNYMYNSRGWLTKINNMPFENTTGFPTCSANPPSGGSGSGGGLPCGECGEEELTLEQLLQVRFNKNLNVDCYLPCNCSNRCDPGAGLPCDSITIEGDTIIYPTDVKYPAELFDVLKCTGEEGLVLGDSLARILGNYAVRNRWKVENESQKFKVETAAYGEQIVDLQGLLDLAGEGADPTIKNPGQKSCTECPAADELPPCTSEQAGSQQAAINGIGANLIGSIDELRFPTNLVRVRLCDGSEIYLFDEELSLLEAGTYFTLQVIPLVDGNSEIVIGGAGENPTQMSLSGFLNVRNTLMFPMG
ncbi:MAG TPA: RHS repeat protein [Bacteroidetes bacterium]|nr:RHS repeat protein [Bacteroidota bacterium]